jgi:hypothetical protein
MISYVQLILNFELFILETYVFKEERRKKKPFAFVQGSPLLVNITIFRKKMIHNFP